MSTDKILIAAAQLNPTVGDVVGNTSKIIAAWQQGKKTGANLLVTTEHSVLGYSPEDLVKKPDVLAECQEAYEYIAETTKNGPDLIVGGPWLENGIIYNVALHIGGGSIKQAIKKHDLPNYGVFDDKRLFGAGQAQEPIVVKGIPLGLMVCEDTWFPEVADSLAKKGARGLISINGSPYEYEKEINLRMDVLQSRVAETRLPLLYVNQVGGQDGVVYDGHSLAINGNGSVGWRSPGWQEHLGLVNFRIEQNDANFSGPLVDWDQGLGQLYSALVLGTRDYICKNGFGKVVIGISGGADSALVAAIACDAIGASNVLGVRLPSEYTADDSMTDADDLAQRLGFKLTTLPIKDTIKIIGTSLTSFFGEGLKDLTEQNMQARARGLLLMAITNQYRHHLLLTTGNKSEMAVGFATLYGDMSGGFNPLKDVYKTTIFKLMEWRNHHKPFIGLGKQGLVIPTNIIHKPPTPDLKPGQTDEAELGSYYTLDPLLEELIENETPINDIVAKGFDKEYVRKISNLLGQSEFKRRQAAPGVKVSRRALYGDRRYPVTNGFRSAERFVSFRSRMNLRTVEFA